jgi:hypothetical protein
VDATRRELERRGRVHIPHEEADVARVCTYHLARGLDVNPEHVLGVERKFVLDLPCGWEVSVKADLLWTPEVGVAVVDDYKTSLHAPPDSEWNRFQVKVGAAALLYGYPVEKIPCGMCGGSGEIVGVSAREQELVGRKVRCEVCAGAGKIETRLERIGGAFSKVRGRELYPRLKLTKTGQLQRNEDEWTRLEIDEFMADLDALGTMVSERLESWVWPARKGSWCNECALPTECPLPQDIRALDGAVEDRAHAAELWQLSLAYKELGSDLEKAVKAWAKASGESVVVGDLEWAWVTSSTTSVRKKGKSTDWEGLIEAIRRAAELGEPFVVGEWIKTGRKQDFKKTKVPEALPPVGSGEVVIHDGADVAAAERAAGRVSDDADERWGADAPW